MPRKVWLINTTVWNGTVPIYNCFTTVPTKELAEKTKDAIDDTNGNIELKTTTCITEIDYYESEEQIPILNKKVKHSN